jgi:hypothetical protein
MVEQINEGEEFLRQNNLLWFGHDFNRHLTEIAGSSISNKTVGDCAKEAYDLSLKDGVGKMLGEETIITYFKANIGPVKKYPKALRDQIIHRIEEQDLKNLGK